MSPSNLKGFKQAGYPALILLGPTGSGKTPLGQLMAQRGIWGRKCVHFDFGTMLRRIASQGPSEGASVEARMPDAELESTTREDPGQQAQATALSSPTAGEVHGFTVEEQRFIRQVLRTGALLEDEHFPLAIKILQYFLVLEGLVGGETLKQAGEPPLAVGPHGPLPWIVLNGLPRHLGQAEALKSWVEVQAVIHLDCPAEVVLERIRSNVGGDRQGRTDDDLSSVKAKLATYTARTEPLIHYYQTWRVPVVRLEVTARMTPAEAWEQLEAKNPWKKFC